MSAGVGPRAGALAEALRGFLNPLAVREILLGAVGFKVSRTCVSPPDAARLMELAHAFGFAVHQSDRKVIHRKDIGKGGWSNTLQAVLPLTASDGDNEIYVASEQTPALQAFEAERHHDDKTFGSLLRIPECCRNMYSERAQLALRKQNDFVSIVADATTWPPPFDPGTNYVAQYFGACLLSHFPCSFRCAASCSLSWQVHATLAAVDRAFADSMLDGHYANILYTEYSGVVAFRDSRVELDDNRVVMSYDAGRLQSTAASPIVEALRAGDTLVASSCHDVEVWRNKTVIAHVSGDDFALCLFR